MVSRTMNQRRHDDNSVRRLVRARGGMCAGLLLLMLLPAGGCKSVYHRARQSLPPDACAELMLRVQESQRAEKSARGAADKLQHALTHPRDTETLVHDLDRLELTALELARRTRIAADAAQRCADEAEASAEIDRLRNLSQALTDWVRAKRHAEGTASPESLQDLLQPDARK
jgi:hypothetical protein